MKNISVLADSNVKSNSISVRRDTTSQVLNTLSGRIFTI
jgi:hypothetical protein